MSVHLTLAERETQLNLPADDHTTWTVHSSDPWFWRRMQQLGIEPVEILEYETKVYHLDTRTVSFRRKMRLSDEERPRRAASAQQARKQRKKTANSQRVAKSAEHEGSSR